MNELNRNLSIISDWFEIKCDSKCIVERISFENDSVVVASVVVKAVDSIRDLGLVIDQFLTFNKRVVCKVGNWQFRDVLAPVLQWNLVNCTVLRHLDYCSFLT